MIKNFLINAIKFYQRNISAKRPPRCRFFPTCSEYGIQAIEIHGVIKGVLFTVCRILKCNPLFKGGYDPVPDCNKKHQKHRKNRRGGQDI